MVSERSSINEQPAASLTIEQLIGELTSRPDFHGAVAWQQSPEPTDWVWRSNNCAAGLVFLQLANAILTQPAPKPPAEQSQA